jgi:type 1 glutamine amidotransferase
MQLTRRMALKRFGAAGLAVGSASALRPVFAVPAAAPLRICMLSGSKEYKSNESLASFQQLLEKRKEAVCSRAFWTADDNLPGLEALETCDVMLLFTKRLKIAGEQLERVKKYCLSGRPIVGVRTASHAFQNWLELDRLVFGGNYTGHYDGGVTTTITVADEANDHPILQGVDLEESPSSLYKNPSLADDTTLLLRGAIPDHTEPLAWTRIYEGARIFYTSLGGPEDFANESFRRLLINALNWTAKPDVA